MTTNLIEFILFRTIKYTLGFKYSRSIIPLDDMIDIVLIILPDKSRISRFVGICNSLEILYAINPLLGFGNSCIKLMI